jgi:hypothetical protein
MPMPMPPFTTLPIPPGGQVETPKQPFTWLDAILLYPITFPFFAPLHFMNGLSGGTGLGYQKFVPQAMIPQNKRTSIPTKSCFDSWQY